MTAQPFDVLIVGARLSGIGAACHYGRDAGIPSRSSSGAASVAPGTCSVTRASVPTLTCRRRVQIPAVARHQVLADGQSIRQYVADTAAEYGVAENIRFGLRVVRRGLVIRGRMPDGTRGVPGNWRTRHYTSRSSSAHRLLQLREGHCRSSPVTTASRAARASATLARGPRLRWQEGRHNRQRRNRNHVVPAIAGDAGHVTMLQRSPS